MSRRGNAVDCDSDVAHGWTSHVAWIIRQSIRSCSPMNKAAVQGRMTVAAHHVSSEVRIGCLLRGRVAVLERFVMPVDARVVSVEAGW
jgi:hypothetical protein